MARLSVPPFSLSSFFSSSSRAVKDPVHPSRRPAPVGFRRSSPLPAFQGVRSFIVPQVSTSSPSVKKPSSAVPRSRGQEFLKRFDATHPHPPASRSPPRWLRPNPLLLFLMASPPAAPCGSFVVPLHPPLLLVPTVWLVPRPLVPVNRRNERLCVPTEVPAKVRLHAPWFSASPSSPVAPATSTRSVPRGTSIPRPVEVPRVTSTHSYIPVRCVASATSAPLKPKKSWRSLGGLKSGEISTGVAGIKPGLFTSKARSQVRVRDDIEQLQR
ncbi:hypothetical protein BO94DRAFT_544948 [Aspergillus sclerotioniger CBS 115572]|uniref:Uncharacterized protein n=1 Tax=Aspergillus sclerotioniger CBS 115572 TaxID=1450535 RepID=A0A317WYX6_9EURO|nr:hypothetical protein BO94DRAFT_544948 [Aspergillus sclerotioniger CBS 115572]PWY91586.1 hypothetical protein BO94DRAFT_544948 [Aspergillus sclerotioniger CBS 115572]